MCVQTYIACGGCNARAADSVREVTIRYYSERSWESLDEDGDATGDTEYDENGPDYSDQSESHYECQECGWTGDNLDPECSDDYCECPECRPEIDNYEDGDAIVVLERMRDYRVPNDPDWPLEVQRLVTDRTIHMVPMRRERAAEIADEVEFDIGVKNIDAAPPVGSHYPYLAWVLDPSLSDYLIEQLSIPEPDEDADDAPLPGQTQLEGVERV